MKALAIARTGVVFAILGVVAVCGGSARTPTSPTLPPLPLASESPHFRFYYSPGDAVQVDRQEAFHEWAVQRLRVALPGKIDYRKYASRQDMGARTGQYNSNAYADPALLTIHTLFRFDNHETVHIYTSFIGRPSDFFDEGIAVAFQTNPLSGDFEPRYNGEQVHQAAARYRHSGTLVLPLANAVTTTAFRQILDPDLSYAEAGSFVAFLIDRFGIDPLLQLFRSSAREDGVEAIRARFQEAFGVALEDAEASWLALIG